MTARAARVDADEVRMHLRIDPIIDTYGLRVRNSGSKLRLAVCPRCGQASSSWAIEINPGKRSWGHYGHGRNEGGSCFGDFISLVAACEGLDVRRDFAKVLERAARIAGVEARSLNDDERALRAAVCERDRAARIAAEAVAEAIEARERRTRALIEWQRLGPPRRHDASEAYLRDRGLDPRLLVDAGHVRFTAAGDIAVPLFDFDGELVTVVRRLIAPSSPGDKIRVAFGGTQRGTLLGRVQAIGAADTMIVEGVMDALTAAQLWPDRLVLGASGAGQLRNVAAAVAPRVRAHGGRLWLVPDADDIGQRCAIVAGAAAIDAGLTMDRDLLVLELGHKDLNDAHCAGWKP